MNRAVIVSFHQYHPQNVTQYYRNFFDYFKQTLEIWGKEFDKLYIVDQDWNFTDKDKDDLKTLTNDFEIMKSHRPGHHWVQFLDLLPIVKEENVMIMDNDTYIYKEGLVSNNFELLESGYDVSSMFDGSGGMREEIWEKFPFLKERSYIRFGPYLCFIKRRLLDGLDFAPKYYKIGFYIDALGYTTKENDWLDSFGEATLKILAKDPKTAFIDDDRTSLYFLPDHTVVVYFQREPTGCYHLRNWNMGPHFINEGKTNKKGYDHFRSITPIQEALRLLGWFWIMSDKCENLSIALRNDILKVVVDYGVNEEEWNGFIIKFKELHKWII